jgi:hypothetical protein
MNTIVHRGSLLAVVALVTQFLCLHGAKAETLNAVYALRTQLSLCGDDDDHDVTYVPSRVRDSLAKFTATLTDRRFASQIALSGGAEAPRISVVRILTEPPAVFARFGSPDGEEFTLRRSTKALAASLKGVKTTASLPRSAAGLTLGDPISKVRAKFGPGVSSPVCGMNVLAYSWETSDGDGAVEYEYDGHGRIVEIVTWFAWRPPFS